MTRIRMRRRRIICRRMSENDHHTYYDDYNDLICVLNIWCMISDVRTKYTHLY